MNRVLSTRRVYALLLKDYLERSWGAFFLLLPIPLGLLDLNTTNLLAGPAFAGVMVAGYHDWTRAGFGMRPLPVAAQLLARFEWFTNVVLWPGLCLLISLFVLHLLGDRPEPPWRPLGLAVLCALFSSVAATYSLLPLFTWHALRQLRTRGDVVRHLACTVPCILTFLFLFRYQVSHTNEEIPVLLNTQPWTALLAVAPWTASFLAAPRITMLRRARKVRMPLSFGFQRSAQVGQSSRRGAGMAWYVWATFRLPLFIAVAFLALQHLLLARAETPVQNRAALLELTWYAAFLGLPIPLERWTGRLREWSAVPLSRAGSVLLVCGMQLLYSIGITVLIATSWSLLHHPVEVGRFVSMALVAWAISLGFVPLLLQARPLLVMGFTLFPVALYLVDYFRLPAAVLMPGATIFACLMLIDIRTVLKTNANAYRRTDDLGRIT